MSRAKTTKRTKKASAMGLYRHIADVLNRPGKKKRESDYIHETLPSGDGLEVEKATLSNKSKKGE